MDEKRDPLFHYFLRAGGGNGAPHVFAPSHADEPATLNTASNSPARRAARKLAGGNTPGSRRIKCTPDGVPESWRATNGSRTSGVHVSLGGRSRRDTRCEIPTALLSAIVYLDSSSSSSSATESFASRSPLGRLNSTRLQRMISSITARTFPRLTI